jgi:uncharacterized protein
MTVQDKAQSGLRLLKEAAVEFLSRRPAGATNHDLEQELGLDSHRLGKHRGWLSWSILSLLMNEGKVTYEGKLYRLVDPGTNSPQSHREQ